MVTSAIKLGIESAMLQVMRNDETKAGHFHLVDRYPVVVDYPTFERVTYYCGCGARKEDDLYRDGTEKTSGWYKPQETR